MTERVLKEIHRILLDLLGRERCRESFEDRFCASYDGSRQSVIPDLLVEPASREEISKILEACYARSVPVTPRGAGSGLTGGAIPAHGGVVLDLSKMDRILELAPKDLLVVGQPGVILADLQRRVEEEGLFYPPDPASSEFATLGGTVAECAGGLRGLKYGVTRDYILGLEVVLADGCVLRTGCRALKSVTGYDLTRLFVGSEGTLGVFTEVTCKLVPLPSCILTLLASFPTVEGGTEAASAIVASRVLPRALEYMDEQCVRCVNDFGEASFPAAAKSCLLVELDGFDEASVERDEERVERICRQNGAVTLETASDPQKRDALWTARRAISPALYQMSPQKVNEDICVPRSRMSEMILEIQRIGSEMGLTIVNFGHAGDGNIHVNVMLGDEKEMERAKEAVSRVFRRSVEMGGTLSGEHGIGISKAPFLSMEVGRKELDVMKRLKALFDDRGILNPGKIFP